MFECYTTSVLEVMALFCLEITAFLHVVRSVIIDGVIRWRQSFCCWCRNSVSSTR